MLHSNVCQPMTKWYSLMWHPYRNGIAFICQALFSFPADFRISNQLSQNDDSEYAQDSSDWKMGFKDFYFEAKRKERKIKIQNDVEILHPFSLKNLGFLF